MLSSIRRVGNGVNDGQIQVPPWKMRWRSSDFDLTGNRPSEAWTGPGTTEIIHIRNRKDKPFSQSYMLIRSDCTLPLNPNELP